MSAVLVAAGLSRRMGSTNKLLLELNGVSMVRRAARRLCDCEWLEVLVVLGHESEQVAAALRGLPVRLVFNPNYSLGQRTSVVAGLRALASNDNGVLIALADQLWLSSQNIREVCEAFETRPRGEVLIPRVDGQRGNPVLMSAEFLRRVLEREQEPRDSLEQRPFIASSDPEVYFWGTSSEHFLRDVDQPKDWSDAKEKGLS